MRGCANKVDLSSGPVRALASRLVLEAFHNKQQGWALNEESRWWTAVTSKILKSHEKKVDSRVSAPKMLSSFGGLEQIHHALARTEPSRGELEKLSWRPLPYSKKMTMTTIYQICLTDNRKAWYNEIDNPTTILEGEHTLWSKRYSAQGGLEMPCKLLFQGKAKEIKKLKKWLETTMQYTHLARCIFR